MYRSVWLIPSMALLACGASSEDTRYVRLHDPAPLDAFSARLHAGCRAEAECGMLQAEAAARVATCHPNAVGRVPCHVAQAELAIARSYVEVWERARRAESERQAQVEAQLRREQEARAAQARAAEAQRQQEEAEQRRREREAAERKAEAAREAEAAAARAEESKTTVRSSPPRPAPPPPSNAGRVCCCDGTISPTCTYVHRGCCSHHGGVCACE